MKVYEIVRSYYNFADTYNYTIGRFENEDLADYVCDEMNKRFKQHDMLNFYVQEHIIDVSGLENWEEVFLRLSKEETSGY